MKQKQHLIAIAIGLTSIVTGQETTLVGIHRIGESLNEWHRLQDPLEQAAYRDAEAAKDIQISPHHLGEQFADWLSLNGLDLEAICAKHPRSDKRMDYKAVCGRLTAISETGRGEFYTMDQPAHRIGWRLAGGRVAAYSVNNASWTEALDAAPPAGLFQDGELHTTANGRAYQWRFFNGKLTVVNVTPDWNAIYKRYSEEALLRDPRIVPTIQDEIKSLTETYGDPSETTAVRYSNAMGAHWQCQRVTWRLADGTLIVAFERTEFVHGGQLELVTFRSKEAPQDTDLAKTNPYKH